MLPPLAEAPDEFPLFSPLAPLLALAPLLTAFASPGVFPLLAGRLAPLEAPLSACELASESTPNDDVPPQDQIAQATTTGVDLANKLMGVIGNLRIHVSTRHASSGFGRNPRQTAR
jgi:hypothetical protein